MRSDKKITSVLIPFMSELKLKSLLNAPHPPTPISTSQPHLQRQVKNAMKSQGHAR
jgi:hypothetical protein